MAAGTREEMVVGGNVGGAVSMTAEVAEGHVGHSPLGRTIHTTPMESSEILYGECGHVGSRRMSMLPKIGALSPFHILFWGGEYVSAYTDMLARMLWS